MDLTAEEHRLRDARTGVPWRFIGPYLSERQWGTVREDYSDNGDAWSYFTHDQARSRAYRWGEDGLAGISDDHQRMCFALAFWNEADPILKERLYGLTNAEGNHGEDVKEYYFYVDNLPTHSYQRWLYKYPQRAFPYADLIHTNRARSRHEMEYELLDTGIFDRRPEKVGARNQAWFHMINHDVISMPDTWEYPWYAAWDLAFHCIPLAMVDPDFATSQLDMMLSQVYLHPTGQIPAYEWNFGDVNPPVHAFATLFMHSVAGNMGAVDLPFLRQSFTRLLLNFTWWVNRKDPSGKNVFEGGFLGLDNIGVFDRSAPLPTGGRLEQADGTAWMALFSQNMLELALALSRYYGDDFTIECPTGSGNQRTLFEVAEEIADRLIATFLRSPDGTRAVYGGTEKFQEDPHWRDLVLFYEYFHGDNGAGLGASHQTGWTGLVAPLIQLFGHLDAANTLSEEDRPLARPYRRVTGQAIADVETVREARGVHP